jgi:ribosomal-protein-alanine N-acetyltransferase
MKTIETPRLLLRKLTIKEYTDLFENYTKQDAMAFFGFNTEEQFQEEKRKYDGGLFTFRTSFVVFQLIEKATSKVIGDCGFHTWYLPHSRAEIGYGLREDKDKNKGYMKEAILAVVDYGFEVMKLNRIEAFISPNNVPSQKLVTGLGFKQEGLLRGHYCKNGVIEDSMIFGLLRKEFEQEIK